MDYSNTRKHTKKKSLNKKQFPKNKSKIAVTNILYRKMLIQKSNSD